MFMFYGIFNLAYGDTRRVIYHVAPGTWLASTWDRTYREWTPPSPIPPRVGMRLILLQRRMTAMTAAKPPLLRGQRWGLRGGGWPPLTIYRDMAGRYFAERTFGSAQIISQQVAREWIECDQEEQL